MSIGCLWIWSVRAVRAALAMHWRTSVVYVIAPSIGLSLGACSKFESYPAAYGLYAKEGGVWQPIGDSKDKVELQLSNDTRFLVHDKRLSMVQDGGFELTLNKFIRNVITENPGGGSRKIAPQGSWEASDRGGVGMQALAVDGKPEMVILQPKVALADGVYSVHAIGKTYESFVVGGNGIFTPLGREQHCFDKIQTRAWGIPMGEKDKFVACSEASPASAAGVPSPPVSSANPSKDLVQLLEKWAQNNQGMDRAKAQSLIASGAKLDALCHRGSMLRCAVLTRDPVLVDLMITAGARSRPEEALLSQAAKSDDGEMVALLIKRKFPINEGSHALCPPIFEAISSNGVAALNILIQNGANVNLDGDLCGTPLQAADNEKKAAASAILRSKGAKS